MTDIVRITADRLVSRNKGQVKFYADDGSIKSLPSKQVKIVEPGQEEQEAVEDSRRNFEAEENANRDVAMREAEDALQEAEGNSLISDAQSGAVPAGATSKRKRGAKKERAVATKKKSVKKKAKAAKKAGSNGALVRVVAGREHDISNYEKVKNASGHTSYDNGDKVAQTLRGKTLDEVYSLAAKKLGATEKELRAKYKNLNPGMQRMNLGNRLRKVLDAKAAG